MECDESGYVIVDGEMKTSALEYFACGDCTRKLLRQVITACGDGATAAFAAEQYVQDLKGNAYGAWALSRSQERKEINMAEGTFVENPDYPIELNDDTLDQAINKYPFRRGLLGRVVRTLQNAGPGHREPGKEAPG